MTMHAFWIPFLFVLGACVGSFLNVVIYRLPRGESISFPPSHCPTCGRQIAWCDNIPLLSWVILRGRCRHCGVGISPRYLLIEAVTALLVSGLYVCYYVLHLRAGAGTFEETWPMFLAHASLLCVLLACTVVDIQIWEVLPEACWLAGGVGIACAGLSPHPWLARVGPGVSAASVGAAVGLVVSMLLARAGYLLPSFLDADERMGSPLQADSAGAGEPDVGEPVDPHRRSSSGEPAPKTRAACTRGHGVNPRVEILREVAYLVPALVGAAIAGALVVWVEPAGAAWRSVASPSSGVWADHVNAMLSAWTGFLVGGAWIWGVRILGTLGFGKEAMGLGDVHILAAVGGVTGWLIPSLAFFSAPFFALLWAVYLLLARNQRELPYGPWLALASVTVMILFDPILRALHAHVLGAG
jgi:leader peptidase (prepilin peptidase)/N-methyltransferase